MESSLLIPQKNLVPCCFVAYDYTFSSFCDVHKILQTTEYFLILYSSCLNILTSDLHQFCVNFLLCCLFLPLNTAISRHATLLHSPSSHSTFLFYSSMPSGKGTQTQMDTYCRHTHVHNTVYVCTATSQWLDWKSRPPSSSFYNTVFNIVESNVLIFKKKKKKKSQFKDTAKEQKQLS